MIDNAPLTRNLCFAIVALTVLFVAMGADPADRLPLGLGTLYWLTHISFGLGAAVIATRALSAWPVSRGWPAWRVVLLGGTLGALAFAPFALGIEALMPSAQMVDTDQDWVDQLEAQGGLSAYVGEFLQLYPSYITAWLLVQSTPLIDAYRPRLAPLASTSSPPIDETDQTVDAAQTGETAQETSSSLPWPPDVGDVIAIRADLHYLHITATEGQTTILGTMAAIDRELADRGVRVHRSFWVASAHVKRMVKSPYGWNCELSDGSRIPVSRRRVGIVKARLNLG